jgi:hypothetical protein
MIALHAARSWVVQCSKFRSLKLYRSMATCSVTVICVNAETPYRFGVLEIPVANHLRSIFSVQEAF